jgi:hypothetical protein
MLEPPVSISTAAAVLLRPWTMPRTHPLFLVSALACLATSGTGRLPAAAAQTRVDPSGDRQCIAESRFGGGAIGCFWVDSINLGPMPGQLYWHIDRFPDLASAEAARSLYGRVTIALGGQIFLQTVNDDSGWAAAGGERLGTIGPLHVPSGEDLTARFMEATLAPGDNAGGRNTIGPQGLFVLSGSICAELPVGEQKVGPLGGLILPTGSPSAAVAGERVQALMLVIHPSSGSWAGRPTALAGSGNCRR